MPYFLAALPISGPWIAVSVGKPPSLEGNVGEDERYEDIFRPCYVRGPEGIIVELAERVTGELRLHFEQSRIRASADLVFCHSQRGCVLDPANLRRRFQAAARRAEIRPVRFHDLRHTFGTRMAAAGAPLRSVQEWLGHSDYRTTLLYADYAPDLSRAAYWAARAFDNDVKEPGPGASIPPDTLTASVIDRDRQSDQQWHGHDPASGSR